MIHKVVALLIAACAVIAFFFSSPVVGDNENDPPRHTHNYPNVFGLCFCPDIAIFWTYDEDCETCTIEGFFVFVSSKTCTHGVLQPPPPQHSCGCPAKNCGYAACECLYGRNGECPCEVSCS